MATQVATPTLRLHSLDGLRGAMCISIVLYHYPPYNFTEGDLPYDGSRYFACFTDIFFVFGGLFVGNVVDRQDYGFDLYRQFIVDRRPGYTRCTSQPSDSISYCGRARSGTGSSEEPRPI